LRNVVIRADGSKKLGLGHITRSIGLAESLAENDMLSIFITKDYQKNIIKFLIDKGFTVESIPADINFNEDFTITKEIIRKIKPGLIITDLCNTNTLRHINEYKKYLQNLKKMDIFLLTIDDLNNIEFPSDIVINPNYGAKNIKYKNTSYKNKYLLGPEYFIFRKEFIEAAGIDKKIRREARNLLITMGGSDQLQLNEKVLMAINNLTFTNLNIRLIIGFDSNKLKLNKLISILRTFEGNYEFIEESDNMAEQIMWSDIAITGGGLTKYETAITGTPSIIISQVEHQHELMNKLEKFGTALYVGFGKEVTSNDIYTSIKKLLEDYSLRKKMSKRGKELFDGKGVKRILSEIPKEVFNER